MWKKFSCFIALFVSIFAVALSTVKAGNEITNEPYDTWIIGLDGDLVTSSMAYEGINIMNVGFNSPQDIYIADADENGKEYVFVADSGNKAIYKFTSYSDVDKKFITEDSIKTSNLFSTSVFGKDYEFKPYGVTVADNGNIYVADNTGYILIFNPAGQLINYIDRPNTNPENKDAPLEPLFGTESKFNPSKVAVDDSYNIYLTSDGNSNGVIQLNSDGSFAGYFGPYMTKSSFGSVLENLINGEDIDLETKQSPTTNVAVDNKNSVYTLVDGEEVESLRKFNVNGTNILKSETDLKFSSAYKDVAVGDDGLIYTVSNDKTGIITVRDTYGSVLFMFGDKVSGKTQAIGNFSSPIGIDVDSNGNIWVLDGVGKNVQVFTKTKFAATVIHAMNLYNDGVYEYAKLAYEQVVAQNASFTQAYIGLGNIAQREQRYEDARDYYKIANYKAGYSNAFWEIRDAWISDSILWVFAIIVLFIFLKFFKVKENVYAKLHFDPEKAKEKMNSNKYVKEFKYLPNMLRHPNDTLYDIKFLQKIRFSTGLIFFVLFVFVNILCDTFVTGYIFRTKLDTDVNILFEILKWSLVPLLCIIGNYLVSSLQKGEGFFRDIFIGVMVAFAPILLFKLPLSIVSNVLTYNEAYIFELIEIVLWVWSIFNVILVIKSVHNYTIGELIVNILLTAVAVIILVFLFLMVYILFMQMYQFISGLITEAILR